MFEFSLIGCSFFSMNTEKVWNLLHPKSEFTFNPSGCQRSILNRYSVSFSINIQGVAKKKLPEKIDSFYCVSDKDVTIHRSSKKYQDIRTYPFDLNVKWIDSCFNQQGVLTLYSLAYFYAMQRKGKFSSDLVKKRKADPQTSHVLWPLPSTVFLHVENLTIFNSTYVKGEQRQTFLYIFIFVCDNS